MELKMLKLKDGPLVVVEVIKEMDAAREWVETNYYRPLSVFRDEENGTYRAGLFLEIADFDKPFTFRDVMFECEPNVDVVKAYTDHWNVNISEEE